MVIFSDVILLFVIISENSPYYFEWGRPVTRKLVPIGECSIKRRDIKRDSLYIDLFNVKAHFLHNDTAQLALSMPRKASLAKVRIMLLQSAP